MFLLALAIEQAVFMETRHSEFEKMMRNVCLNGACDRLAICLKIQKFRKNLFHSTIFLYDYTKEYQFVVRCIDFLLKTKN